MKPASEDVRMEALAHAGKVRIGLFPSFFYVRNAGGLSGFGIEFARAFAKALELDVQFCEQSAPPTVVQALVRSECDFAFLGIDPTRSADLYFSPPFIRADFTFLVPGNYSANEFSEVDRAGTRIAVVRDHAMDLALRKKMAHAQVVYAATPDEAFECLRSGRADVLAGIKPGLMKYASMLESSRVLNDCYGSNNLAFAVAKDRGNWLSYATDFLAHVKTTGQLGDIIRETQLAGVEVVY